MPTLPPDNGKHPALLSMTDVAPKFYPVLSSFPGLGLLCWAGDAAGDGAELLAFRSARAR